jgi:hypothetical protein
MRLGPRRRASRPVHAAIVVSSVSSGVGLVLSGLAIALAGTSGSLALLAFGLEAYGRRSEITMLATRVARTTSPGWSSSGTPSGPSRGCSTVPSGNLTATS